MYVCTMYSVGVSSEDGSYRTNNYYFVCSLFCSPLDIRYVDDVCIRHESFFKEELQNAA